MLLCTPSMVCILSLSIVCSYVIDSVNILSKLVLQIYKLSAQLNTFIGILAPEIYKLFH